MKKIKVVIIVLLGILLFTMCIQMFDYDNGGRTTLKYHNDSKAILSVKVKGLIIFVLGIVLVFIPKKHLTFGERWKYKGSIEPSDISITANRIVGFIMASVGLLMLFST